MENRGSNEATTSILLQALCCSQEVALWELRHLLLVLIDPPKHLHLRLQTPAIHQLLAEIWLCQQECSVKTL